MVETALYGRRHTVLGRCAVELQFLVYLAYFCVLFTVFGNLYSPRMIEKYR